ncbi:MAG: PhoD-like phosphatase N-terminal domain-containing protein, partial [Cyclobacteriaceae bacterium]|nr:PhoD-like phosphatase N-terminal domain-containing protein [Cyclobacteriaceae bacterium]
MKSISYILLLLPVLIISSCSSYDDKPTIFLAQGLMSGEPASSSIILQSRLTAVDTLVNGDIPGTTGIGRFEIADNEKFESSIFSDWLPADATYDFIIKYKVLHLKPGTKYFYRLQYGVDRINITVSPICSFSTLSGAKRAGESSFAVVTGMNYYFFHYGKYNRTKAYSGKDKQLGYPALKSILDLKPDFFIGTGDNVYFDHPSEQNYQSGITKGNDPHPGEYEGKEVIDESGMRKKYHEQ